MYHREAMGKAQDQWVTGCEESFIFYTQLA